MSPVYHDATFTGAPDDPRFHAGIDLLGRSGAKEVQIRYDDEQDPVVWVAVVTDGQGSEAAGALTPLGAVMRLLEDRPRPHAWSQVRALRIPGGHHGRLGQRARGRRLGLLVCVRPRDVKVPPLVRRRHDGPRVRPRPRDGSDGRTQRSVPVWLGRQVEAMPRAGAMSEQAEIRVEVRAKDASEPLMVSVGAQPVAAARRRALVQFDDGLGVVESVLWEPVPPHKLRVVVTCVPVAP